MGAQGGVLAGPKWQDEGLARSVRGSQCVGGPISSRGLSELVRQVLLRYSASPATPRTGSNGKSLAIERRRDAPRVVKPVPFQKPHEPILDLRDVTVEVEASLSGTIVGSLRGGNSSCSRKTCCKPAHPNTAEAPVWARPRTARFLELGAEVYLCGRRQDVLAQTEQSSTSGPAAAGTQEDPHPTCDVRDAARRRELIGAIWPKGRRCAHEQRAGISLAHRRPFAGSISIGSSESSCWARCTRRLACGRRWLAESREVLCSTSRPLHDDGLGLRCAVGGGEGGRAMPYAQFGRRMGESRDSDERDRAGPIPPRGCILAPAAPAQLAKRQEAHSSGTIRHHREFAQSGRILVSDGSGYINGTS